MGVTSLLTKFERMRLYRAPFFLIRIFLLFEVKALCFLSSPLPTLRSFCFDTGTHWGRAGRKGGGRSDGCATYMDVRQAIWYIWPLAISRGGEGGKRGLLYESCKKGVGAAHFPTAAKAPDSRSFLRLFLSASIPSFLCPPTPTLICTTIRPQRPLGPFSPPRSLLRLWAPPLRSRRMPNFTGFVPRRYRLFPSACFAFVFPPFHLGKLLCLRRRRRAEGRRSPTSTKHSPLLKCLGSWKGRLRMALNGASLHSTASSYSWSHC